MTDISKVTESERIKQVIAKLTLQNVFWGYLFNRIRRHPNPTLPSPMGVAPLLDGTVSLEYNPEMTKSTDDKTLHIILEHEGMHLLNKHIPRLLSILNNEPIEQKKYMKSMVWNIAADCCVNTQAKLPRKLVICNRDFELCFPDTYGLPDKKASEFYYHRLLKKQEENKKNGKGISGKDQGDDESEGKGKGEKGNNIDDHSRWGELTKQTSDVSSLVRKIEGYVSNIVADSVKNLNQQRGSLPGHIQELIKEMLSPPTVPYYDIIKKLVRGTRYTKYQRCLTRINRKRTYVFDLSKDGLPEISPFPGKKRDFTFNIGILIDTSGSMSKEEILEGLSGIKHVIEKDRYCKTTVIENDTQIQKEYVVKRVHDIEFNVKGRGGTTLYPGLRRFRELGVDVVLGFTDAGCENLNEIPVRKMPKKIIWAIDKRYNVSTLDRTGILVRI